MKENFDTSDFPQNHRLYSNENKKVLGKMKDECNGVPISECVCLRSKNYSIMKIDKKVEKDEKYEKKHKKSKRG